MSSSTPPPPLTQEQTARFHETRQPALWASLSIFLVINNVTIAARLWATWNLKSRSRHMPVIAESVTLVLSGVLLDVIIANLMAATHYGLGLHLWTVNALDAEYPRNLSHAFMHIWITMVLMSSFFTCIKLTLLFFYKRLFLVTDTKLRVFWWVNLVYVVLWFFGGTGFYLFQCKPVQWYFMQYYFRFGKPVPGNLRGQCNATSVLNVSLPMVFSLLSDIGLLVLPLWAIWDLRLSRWKKIGLFCVFGIGFAACLLELARILNLLIDTDDKTDPSYGVANFLIFTAAEETAAVVCACLPVIGPQAYKFLKRRHGKGASGGNSSGRYNQYVSSGSARQRGWHRHATDGFHRFGSEHHVAGPTMTTTTTTTTVAAAAAAAGDFGVSGSSVVPGQESDTLPLQTIVFAEKGAAGYTHHREEDMEGAWQGTHVGSGVDADQFGRGPLAIHVRTDVRIVHTDIEAQTGSSDRGYPEGYLTR